VRRTRNTDVRRLRFQPRAQRRFSDDTRLALHSAGVSAPRINHHRAETASEPRAKARTKSARANTQIALDDVELRSDVASATSATPAA